MLKSIYLCFFGQNSLMLQNYGRKIKWDENSVIRIKSADGHSITLQKCLLKFRWKLFNRNQEEAIDKLKKLKKSEIQMVLSFLYGDLPPKDSNIFLDLGIHLPKTINESTLIEKMRELMHDTETTDFVLVSDEDDEIPCHMCILASRSQYFFSLFTLGSSEVAKKRWKPTRNISTTTMLYFKEYLYTGQIKEPKHIEVIPVIWMVKYLKLSGEHEIENIVQSAVTKLLDRDTVNPIRDIAREWNISTVLESVETFRKDLNATPAI